MTAPTPAGDPPHRPRRPGRRCGGVLAAVFLGGLTLMLFGVIFETPAPLSFY